MAGPRVAFLGLGRMGSPMAANIAAAGFPVTAYNRTIAKAEELAAAAGTQVAATPAAAVAEADIVITMMANADALRDVCDGPAGILASLRPGAIVIDMGTTGPEAIAALDVDVRERGGVLLDCPVSGSTATAQAAALTLMVGGPADAVEQARPVLESMSQRIYPLGPVGAGSAMKLAVNLVIFGIMQSVSEALVLAEAAGIDRAQAYDVFENSAVGAPVVKYRHANFVTPETAPTTFTLELTAKDLGLILGLASTVGTTVPLSEATLAVTRDAIAAGLGDRDVAELAVHLRRQRDARA